MAGMDRRTLSAAFQLLDSRDIHAVNDFVENLKLYEKDSWVVESLITYYMSTQSQKAADLIVHSHSDHDKVILKRLHNTYDDINTRKATLKLLLYIVSKKPPWLYKIIQEQIIKDVVRCIKVENHVPLLLDAIYIITMLLPVIPDGLVKFFDEIFEALLRITHYSFHNKDDIPNAYLLHLNVALYALYSRLYGMYPWHYIFGLNELYATRKLQPDFYKDAIEPMLGTMKLNPALVTASKDAEKRGDQWKTKAMHDIIADCASLSLEQTESTKDYKRRCPILVSKKGDTVEDDLRPEEEIAVTSKLISSEELSAPIEMAKDSLISAAANSSTFFSPSDRLGLSTPPPSDRLGLNTPPLVDPATPSSAATSISNFTFVIPTSGTPPQNAGLTKTPQNTSHSTPIQYTPKNTPTTPLIESGGMLARSRHTSSTKISVSRISVEESIPPSPLRKEFTSEPPTDIPKIKSVSSDNGSANTATTLSVSNLPHLLEKISDTGSAHDTDASNNSEDEEVESINTQPVDLQTVHSVVEFMKSVNRIRFISMTQGENETDKMTRMGLRRSGSCPTFTEDMLEESQDVIKPSVGRSASIQTTSSNSQRLSKNSPGSSNTEEPTASITPASIADTKPEVATATNLLPEQLTGIHSVYQTSLSSSSQRLPYEGAHILPGPGAKLDKHIILLNEKLRLGSVVQSQLQETNQLPSPAAFNWAHFGGAPPTDDASIARVQLLLLHTQLLYERQKKELHAERNRRLLSKIAKAEKIKENNQTLEWQLSRSKDDIFNLQTTIRLQNNEIHRMREEKTRNDTSRELEQAALIKENERLQYAKEELQRDFISKTKEFDQKRKELAESIGRIELLEQDLQMVYAELAQYKCYEDEVSRMKKELLLMGEIQVKYEEKLSALKYDNHLVSVSSEQESIYLTDIAKLKEALQKAAEDCSMKQNIIEVLNNKIKDKEQIIYEQQKQMRCLQGEHTCRLQATEEKYTMSQAAIQALEVQIISLYDKIGRLAVPTAAKPRTCAASPSPSPGDDRQTETTSTSSST